MKSVLISIQPKWCELIMKGKKTVEVRKTRPKLEVPFKVYIYMSKSYDVLFGYGKPKKLCVDGGKVIGEFVCDYITGLKADNMVQAYYNNTKDTCLNDEDIKNYAKGKKLYYWHISDLAIYDTPKELSEFYIRDKTYDNSFGWAFEDRPKLRCLTRPPQSWCYVNE